MRISNFISSRRTLTIIAMLLIGARLNAEVRLPALFSDHMVLQSGIDVPIWGWADAGEAVAVRVGDQDAKTKAGDDGKWMVKLHSMKASSTPVEMTVSGGDGKAIKRTDVLIGEVWIGSGQSNMAFTVNRELDSEKHISEATNGLIRLFSFKRHAVDKPLDDVEGKWEVCTPKTAPAFSAVLYHFGKDVQERIKVPVGLIHSSWGGTAIESWMPREAFATEQEIQDRIKRSERFAREQAATRRATTAPAKPGPQAYPMSLFNGMIAPLIPYGIRGVVWYQGEANTQSRGAGPNYAQLMKSMVDSWRTRWGQGDWAFYYVQLAPYGGYKAPPTALPEMWEQQTRALSIIKNSGMAGTADVGNPANIHPINKPVVGRRLALIALSNTYGVKDLVYEGPMYESSSVDGSAMRVRFKGIGSGLVSRDGKELNCFEIAREDGSFVPATAKIDGNEVVVSSDQVNKPTAVRFAWSTTADPNLMNKEGLPAVAFRTDSK